MARLNSKMFPALTEDMITKLQSRNIFTVYDFMLQTCDDLMTKTGLGFKEIEDIRNSIFKNFGGEIEHPLRVYERELPTDVIPTGINNLDVLLKGGLQCHKIYEFCGSSSAGKSQLCHWISMHATLKTSTTVHYIDASNNFRSTRIQMMLEAQQCNNNIIGKVMSRIRIHQIQELHEMFTVLHHLSNLPKSDSKKRLVIVDSLSVLRAMTPGTELNPILSNLASVSRYIVNHLLAAVVFVNTVRLEKGGNTQPVDEGDITGDANLRPSLGSRWLHVPNVRLLITHLENSRREIAVWESSQLENENKCFVVIRDEGIFSSS